MHEPVLVLNANFEPINVCTTRRAVGLLLAGKADMVVNGRGHIHTVKELLPRPSVIRQPKRLIELGFQFQFGKLEEAMEDLLVRNIPLQSGM